MNNNITGTLYVINIEIKTELINNNICYLTKLYFDKEKSGKNICENLNKYINEKDNSIIIYNPRGPIKYANLDSNKKISYHYVRNNSLQNNYILVDLTPEELENNGYRFKVNKMTLKTDLAKIINTNNKEKLNPVNTVIYHDKISMPKYSVNKQTTVDLILAFAK